MIDAIFPASQTKKNSFVLIKPLNLKGHSALCKTPQKDTFVRSKPISFGSAYQQVNAIEFIEQISKESITPIGSGYQGAFYKLNDEIGIKAPKPLFPTAPDADLNGVNNIKEYFILNKLKKITPELAVNPIDLINHNNKNYLVMDIVSGKHPFNATLTPEHTSDILKKAFELDINGIAHSDLQSGNMFLLNNGKAKFIDFGAYSCLANDGNYLHSASLSPDMFSGSQLAEITNSSVQGKFLATFYTNQIPEDLKNYSDNSHLKIRSNVSNFEFRTIYDYLKAGKAENPKEFLTSYLKSKAQHYHQKMATFLEDLAISPTDLKQLEQRKLAVATEKTLTEVFSNPSENVLRAELGKIQLKWLINDHKGAKTKAFDYCNSLFNSLNEFDTAASGAEKMYFKGLKKTLAPYREMLDFNEFKGAKLDDKDNLVKIIFDKTVQIQEQSQKSPATKSSSKLKIILLATTLLLGALGLGKYLYNKYSKIEINKGINKK